MSDFLSSLALNLTTRRAAVNYLKSPAHALLIVGPAGSGKATLAKALATEVLGLQTPAKLNNYPFFKILSKPEGKSTIPIEDIRSALARTKLKNTGSARSISRVIFIDNAANLGQDAQNVLLKDLEEPGPGLAFILTADSSQNVLPTIASRCQKIKCAPISADYAAAYFNKYDQQTVNSAWALSGGSVGLLSELLTQGDEHPLKQAVAKVKFLMKASEYERLIALEEVAKDKVQLEYFLAAQEKVLEALHRGALNQEYSAQTAQFLRKRRRLHQLGAQLQANASPRLIAAVLALEV